MAQIRVHVELIESIRATAAALIAQCEAVLAESAPPEPTPDPSAPASDASGRCLHPNKKSAARMNHMDAWYCPDCHEQGEG